jgi:eukaryotic-like serine/threonine-protein kinase
MRVCPKCGVIYSSKPKRCGIDGEALVDSDEDPLVGRTLDRYKLIQPLGSGGMGCVYLAEHTVLDREYAVKILYGELAAEENLVKRFTREAKYLSQVKHKNVVHVTDFGRSDAGLTYLVMEHLQGISLKELIDLEGQMTSKDIAVISRQVFLGLAAIHDAGFVHRDVKPSNIMLVHEDGQDVAKILDFGLASIIDDEARETKLTKAGQAVGTPTYMAPEQVKAAEVGAPADVYAMGIGMYEALTGAVPFHGNSSEVMIAHVTKEVPTIVVANGLEIVIAECLQKDPSSRPTIPRLLEMLKPWVGHDSLDSSASIPAVLSPAERASRREAALQSGLPSTSPSLSVANPIRAVEEKSRRMTHWILSAAAVVMFAAVGWAVSNGPMAERTSNQAVTTVPMKKVGLPNKKSEAKTSALDIQTPPPPESKVDTVRPSPPVVSGSDPSPPPPATPALEDPVKVRVQSPAPKKSTPRSSSRGSTVKHPKSRSSAAKKPTKSVPPTVPRKEVAKKTDVTPRVAQTPGRINIVAVYEKRPRPVEIFVNGKAVGTTPLRLKLKPGTHKIEMRPAGLPARVRDVVIKSGRNPPVVFNLSDQ